MKKKIIARALLGAPVGISIGYIITIAVAFFSETGEINPCMPVFSAMFEKEAAAAAVQLLICAFIGAVFAGASVIWEIDSWNIARQSCSYFAVISAVYLPAAYITGWMEHSFAGFFKYAGIFAGVFILVWTAQYLFIRRRIRKVSEKIKSRHKAG